MCILLLPFTVCLYQDYDYEEQLQLHPHEELEMSYNAAKKKAAKKKTTKRKSVKETSKKIEVIRILIHVCMSRLSWYAYCVCVT